jgi:translation elongation factor EF-1beta
MANMILRYKVMPAEDSDVEYKKLEKQVEETIQLYDKNIKIKEVEKSEIGFGICGCEIEFEIDENLGSEDLETELNKLDMVGDVQVIKMDRI